MTIKQITTAFANAPSSKQSNSSPGKQVNGDSIFKNLSISNLQVTSEDQANKITNFSGTLNKSSVANVEPLKKLINLTGNVTVIGSVNSSDVDNPEIDISGDLTFTSLNLMDNLINLEVERLQLVTIYPEDDADSEESAESKACLNGKITISAMELNLNGSYTSEAEGWLFEGSTGEDETLEIEDLITCLKNNFNVDNNQIPDAIKDLSLEALLISFGTNSKNFKFTCEATIPIGESTDDEEAQETVKIKTDIELTRIIGALSGTSTYNVKFGGQVIVNLDAEDPDDVIEFNVVFDQAEGSKTFIATYTHSDSRQLLLKDVVKQIAPSLGSSIPDSIEIDIKNALLAVSNQSTASTTKFLFGLNVGAGLNLSGLPLVGDQIPTDQNIGIENLQVLVASQIFNAEELTTLNDLFPEDTAQLPTQEEEAEDSSSSPTPALLKKGVNLTAVLNFGTYNTPLSLPLSDGEEEETDLVDSEESAEDGASSSDNTVWFKIQKSLGPFHFEKIGVQYQKTDSKFWFMLDAALSVGPMALSLNGLALGSSLNEFTPDYELNGLGLAYTSESLEISGAFLRSTKEYNGITYDEYQGLATIKAKLKGKDLALSAIGSYAYYNGQPSLFLYAVLEFPIGGPPFFFVEGLAAGFGYNRWLTVPSVEEMGDFPLVSQVIEGVSSLDTEDKGSTLTSQLEQLDKYITPSPGSGFIAIGVKFSSFKLIDSFALITIAWGDKFELNLIGVSSLKIPTPEAGKSITPIAEVKLILKARFAPDEGILSVRAVLDPASYLLSQSCRLTGGFAFYSWFAGPHEGDFVITLGGYHPAFNVPDHYPQVPRLGFNWQVDDSISIKGEAYFALCSHAVMAGGRLEARYESGSAKAWFIAGADFLICWKPYHYDISIYLEIGAQYSIFGPLRLGASLHIWGPEFGGTATIDVWLFSFTVTFGDQSSRFPAPIDWNTFKESFLPKEEDVCSISVARGLVREIKQGEGLPLSVINPKEFAVVTNAIIPTKQAFLGQESNALDTGNANQAFGVTPVGIRDNDLETTQRITVKRENNGNWDVVNNEFAFNPIHKQMPTAMWGNPNVSTSGGKEHLLPPGTNDIQFVKDTLSGFEIVPANAPDPGDTDDIPTKRLQYDTVPVNSAYGWQTLTQFSATSGTDSQHQQTVRNSIATNLTRDRLLRKLGFNPDETVNVSAEIADTFLAVPQVK